MLCQICSHIDFDQAQLPGGFPHYASCSDLVKSADEGCELCRKIWNSLREPVLFFVNGVQSRGYVDVPWIGPLKFCRKIWNTFRRPWSKNLLSPEHFDVPWSGPLKLCFLQDGGSENAMSIMEVWKGGHPFSVAELEIYADSDSEAAIDNIVSSRPVPELSGSDASYALARTWIKNCLEEHSDSCPVFPESRLPTRVLDVGSSDDDAVYIRLTGRQRGTWISLSHCWGTENHFTLVSSTPLGEPLNIQALPATFRDAITVTRRLGYRYIWIDSLCILQDSRTDWATESSLMQEYYRHAMLTIAVNSALGDHEGFLGKARIPTRKGIQVPFWTGLRRRGDVYIRDNIDEQKRQDGYLDSRAWTLQEALLSPRVLVFGKTELYLNCSKCWYTEGVEGHQTFGSDQSFGSFGYKNPKPHFLSLQREKIDPRQRWMEIVNEYALRQITFDGDRLPAISGIAREISSQTKMTYKAGLWEEDFIYGLLWATDNRGKPHSRYIAPSWSWASIKFPDHFARIYGSMREFYVKIIATLVACEVIPVDGDLYGQIQSARLTITGPIIAASQLYTHLKLPHMNRMPGGFDHDEDFPDVYLPSSQSHRDTGHFGYCFDICDDDSNPSTRLLSNIYFLQILKLSDGDFTKEHLFEWVPPNEPGFDWLPPIEFRPTVVSVGLMLVQTEESGVYQRVGSAKFHSQESFANKWWETRTISII